MRLVEARVFRYRNILDSTPVAVDDEVTCLVGKNESGKSAFLEALEWLKPARPDAEMDTLHRYPAWRERRDRRREEHGLDAVHLIQAVFRLDDDDRHAVAENLGADVLQADEFIVRRAYDGTRSFELDLDSTPLIRDIVNAVEIDEAVEDQFADADTFEQLDELLDSLEEVEAEETVDTVTGVREERQARLGDQTLEASVAAILEARVPQFFYFPEYATLPSEVDIQAVLQANPEDLDQAQYIARQLLLLAAARQEYLQNPDYERRKRELENAANELTNQILQYWSQNPELQVEIDIDLRQAGNNVTRRYLKVRMRDGRHMLSLPFDEKSTGFQWFFSFLASFSRFIDSEEPVIILLDEPALGLHAKAQKDFLEYIDSELAPIGQVLYTTHSPFMVQPEALHRVRLVEDRGIEDGAQVTDDVLAIDSDTLFPLQGALGYDMAQHLFIAPNNLVVEGTSDYTYLSVLSDHLDGLDRTSLSPDWSIVPVGGADMIPTFVSLLGQHLEVTVLVDGQRADHQRLNRLSNDGYLARQRIIPVAEVLERTHADIEDVFTPSDYVMLFNRAFDEDVDVDDLEGTDPIVSRIARHRESGDYNHGIPANELLNNRDEILPELSEDTLSRFEDLFGRINGTLGVPE